MRRKAERLDGSPAPKFARETLFAITVDGGTLVTLDSRQERNGLFRGAVIRLFGGREVAKNLDDSLSYLAQR